MKEIDYKGKKGVFFTQEEYEQLSAKIQANNILIKELMKEVGLNEQTI